MMKNYIANIVSNGSKISGKVFNVVNSIKEIDKRFPTLIIGWDYVKENYPEASILDWKINDMLYWTHYKNVKRTRYESDIKRFKELSIKRIGKYIEYSSFSMIIADDERIRSMFSSISGPERKYCYITDNEIFIYYKSLRKVIGISLDEAEYLGYDKEDIKSFLKVPSNELIYNDYDIPFEIKDREEYKRYMVPFLIEVFENE